MTPKGLLTKIEAMDGEAIIAKAFDDTRGDLIRMNKERMLDGIRADGTEMPFYSYVSQTVYGYPNTRIKLRATGAFQQGIFVEFTREYVHTDSHDSKSDLLKGKYGEQIFGLGGDYKQEYIDVNLRPAVNSGIKAATGLKFN